MKPYPMTRKSINKRIIWLVIGTTVAGVAKMASSEKGKAELKGWTDKLIDSAKWIVGFVQDGLKEMKKHTDWKQVPEDKNPNENA